MNGFDGANITVSVAKGKVNGVSGDGKVIAGHFIGGTNNFGAIKIAGDLGEIDAGGAAFSRINGSVGAFTVAHDVVATNFYAIGDITSVKVGGSLIGGSVAGEDQIYTQGNLGKATIKGDVRAGSMDFTGVIGAGHEVGSIATGGSIYGGAGKGSGLALAGYEAAATIIKVTVGGSVFGGKGHDSGEIGNLTSVVSHRRPTERRVRSFGKVGLRGR